MALSYSAGSVDLKSENTEDTLSNILPIKAKILSIMVCVFAKNPASSEVRGVLASTCLSNSKESCTK